MANFTRETEYLSPTETVLVKRTHKFDLNSVIVDIAGGEPLPSRLRSETLTSPGEILVVDSLGNLAFHNELEDIPAYKQYTYRPPEAGTEEATPEEEPEPEAGSSRENRAAGSSREPRAADAKR